MRASPLLYCICILITGKDYTKRSLFSFCRTAFYQHHHLGSLPLVPINFIIYERALSFTGDLLDVYSQKRFYPPPHYGAADIAITPKTVATIAAIALSLLTVFAVAIPKTTLDASIASAAVPLEGTPAIKQGDLLEITAPQTITLDTTGILYDTKPIFSTQHADLFHWEDDYSVPGYGIFFRGAVIYTGGTSLRHTGNAFTLRWNNVGVDADNNRIDVEMTCAGIDMEYWKYRDGHEQYFIADETVVMGQYLETNVEEGPPIKQVSVQPQRGWFSKMRFSLKFYRSGTDELASGRYLMGIKDLDIPGFKDMHGDWLAGSDYSSEYAEQIVMIDGAEELYINENNFLNILREKQEGANDIISFLPTKGDLATYDSGFVASLAPSSTFEWHGGDSAGTVMLEMFEPHIIHASKDAGGVITYEGDKLVGWKADATYTIKADPSHKLSSIIVDGVPIEIEDDREMEYVFSNVREDHTIHVSFVEVPVSIAWIDALTGEEIASYGLLRGETSPIPLIPSHRGHRFAYLTGDDWSSVVANSTVYVHYSPYLYTVPHYSSANYNGFTFAYKTT